MRDRTSKKKQRKAFSGKKKKHTLKAQVVVDGATEDIVCVFFAQGHEHDFTMFKESRLPLASGTTVMADKGYQGIANIHSNSLIPVKASKNHKLTQEEKAYNSAIGKRRIRIEHVNRYLKRFRILSSRYRNKQKRFGLRFSLIAGIYNFQHKTTVSE